MFPPPVLSSSRKQKQVASEANWESVCQSQPPWGHLESYRCLLPQTHSGSVDYVVVSTDLLRGNESLCEGGRKERKACDFELRIEATILGNLKILLRAVCWFSEEWQDLFQMAPGNLREAAGVWKLGALHPKVITLDPGLHSTLLQCL